MNNFNQNNKTRYLSSKGRINPMHNSDGGLQWSPSVVNVEGEAKLGQFCLQPKIYYKRTV